MRRRREVTDVIGSRSNRTRPCCISSYYTEEQYLDIQKAIIASGAPNTAAFIEELVLREIKLIKIKIKEGKNG